MTVGKEHVVYLQPSEMWLKDYFPGMTVIEVQPVPVSEPDVCSACGEPEDADGYCPTVHAKLELARKEFDEEDAQAIAEEWDWWHRHPNADRWTQM